MSPQNVPTVGNIESKTSERQLWCNLSNKIKIVDFERKHPSHNNEQK